MRKQLKDLLVNEYDSIRFDIGGKLSIWIELNFNYEFGEKTGEFYCAEYFYEDEYLCGFDEGFKITPSDTIKTIKHKAKEYLKDKYVCIEDRQGGEFRVGEIKTILEWKEWAIYDRKMCGSESTIKTIKSLKLKEIINWIADFWEITIVKATA